MKMLEELFYGNLFPHERYIKRGSEYHDALELLDSISEKLTAQLTDEQKERFERFKECNDEIIIINEREMFTRGFVLGSRIMLEVMNSTEDLFE